MSVRRASRFPWIDLWILPAIVIIAWAVFRLAKVEPEIGKHDRDVEDWRNVFKQCQQWLKEGADNPDQRRREADRKWQETMALKGEYLNVAQRLEAAVPELQSALNGSASRKDAAEEQRRLQELRAWIGAQQARVGAEQLDSKSRELKERLDGRQLSGTHGLLFITQDLASLLAAVDRNYGQFLSDFKSVTDNLGKPLVGKLLTERRASGHRCIQQLSELAQQARQNVQTIQTALETEPASEATPRSRRQQEMLQNFLDASSPGEFARSIEPRLETYASYGRSPTSSLVRQVRYALLATLAALFAFLIVDVYRRMVVAPLRLKLVEREGLIEHQKKLAHFEELAAGLAHEIRNPLTAISARLYTIQRKLREGTPEHQDALVIGGEIERANQILKEFIQVTRPTPPRLELITAGPLLEDISQLMKPQLARQAVKLEVQLPARTQFYADQQQLKQVLVNLVQNAAESMNHGGEVILRAREGKVPFKGALTRAAIIEVEDNGPGIRPEVQDRLFEPFFSTKKEGTGLGLPISARIIDRHGGTLDFETQPEHGTIFRIVLPNHEEQ